MGSHPALSAGKPRGRTVRLILPRQALHHELKCRQQGRAEESEARTSAGLVILESNMSWVEEYFDYQNQLGVSAGMIYGIKKTVFNSADFAVLTVSSYAATP